MTITYPLTHPATPRAKALNWEPVAAVAVGRSPFTFQSQTQVHPGQMWRLALELPPMKRAAAEAWITFRLALNGRQGTFLLGDHAASTPRGSVAGTPVVDGAGQSGQVLALRGFTNSAVGVLLAGDYLQLGSGATARLHKVLFDVNADGAGKASIDIWPRLRSAPADGAAVVTTNAQGVFRMVSNVMPWDVRQAKIYGLDFNVEEAL